MCGIAGVVQHNSPVEESTIQRMCDAMIHRGPDHGGIMVDHIAGLSVGIGSRRLSIIDLSDDGTMPMCNEAGDIWIVYNGELYNHAELRPQLIDRGHVYHSQTDTETIIHAYEEYGTESLAKFNGMFAFALYDQRHLRLVLARDPMGIKPLYYSWDGQSFVFSSELRSLAASRSGHLAHSLSVNPVALSLYFSFGYVPSPYAMCSNVQKLPPGHLLVLENQQINIRPYWSANTICANGYARASSGQNIEHTRTLLNDAVERQLMSDVPVGVFLSGGLDSSIITALAQKHHSGPLDTFSIGFQNTEGKIDPDSLLNQDLLHARKVSESLGTHHHEILVRTNADTLTDLLLKTVNGLDEPLWEQSFMSLHLMSKLARDNGVLVILTGDGGDELFAGYPWYPGGRRFEMYNRIPLLKQTLPALSLIGGQSTVGVKARDLQRKLRSSPVEYYHHTHDIFTDDAKSNLLQGATFPAAVDNLLTDILEQTRFDTLTDRIALADLFLWVREHFNHRVDRMSMLNSIESRVPLQDLKVVEFGLQIPLSGKMPHNQGKYLLREAFGNLLPPEVLTRPKRPFAAPTSGWLRGPLKELAADYLASPAAINRSGLLDVPTVQDSWQRFINHDDEHAFKVSALLNFQLWAEAYL